jgi:cytochrome P450
MLTIWSLQFSAGARGCIGRNITYLEQTVVLASLVHRYDFELLSPDWVLPQYEAFTCSPGDFPVKIRRRVFPELA